MFLDTGGSPGLWPKRRQREVAGCPMVLGSADGCYWKGSLEVRKVEASSGWVNSEGDRSWFVGFTELGLDCVGNVEVGMGCWECGVARRVEAKLWIGW